ncbi:hypothetical protein ABFA07_011049 [Porites harrisoni]
MTQHKLIFEAVKEERIISQLRRCVLPVGSMFEGSHIAECPSDGGISQEMDFMLILPDVTASERDDGVLQCCSIEGPNPGYVNLKVMDATRITLEDTPVMQDIIRDPMAMFYEVHNDELFLSHKFVRVFERRVEYAVTMVMGTKFASARGLELGMKRKSVADLYPVMTIFFKEPIHCLIWPDSTTWPDCALGALFDTLSIIQDRQRDVSWQNQIIDIAPAILCDVPVNVKHSWIKRKRFWPCQSIAELLLSSAIKPWEKQCLMVLKALRRKYLQEPKVIASYHLKTVLFHVLESLPRRKRESLSRGVFLEKLLDQIIYCVRSKNLPNFFIPENNMFRHCEDADLSTVLLKLQDMKENLLAYLTEDLFTTSVTEEREEGEFQETYWGVI